MLFMKESCPPCQISLSLLSCAFISPSSLYSSFSFLSHLLTPPAPSPVFHLSGSPHLFSESIRISLWTVFILFLALSLSLYMLRAFVMKLKFLPYSQNRHIDSRFSRRNKIFWTSLGRSGCNFDTKRWVNNQQTWLNSDLKQDWTVVCDDVHIFYFWIFDSAPKLSLWHNPTPFFPVVERVSPHKIMLQFLQLAQLWTRERPVSSYQRFPSFLPPLLTLPNSATVAMWGSVAGHWCGAR